MALSTFTLAQASGTGFVDFVKNLFTGALAGDMLSLFVVGLVVLLLIRLLFARWVFTLSKQLLLFGGLGFAVWWSSGEITERFGQNAGYAVLAVGGLVTLAMLWAMLYTFFKRRAREGASSAVTKRGQRAEKGGPARIASKKARSEPGKATRTRVGSGILGGQGLKVHQESASPEVSFETAPAAAGGGGGGAGGGATPTGGAPVQAHGHGLEDVLSKINVLGANKDQSLLTVMVLILVAQFGVFTSKTIAAPSAQVGMVIAGVFAAGAVVFVKTSYQNYWRGVTHFVFATVFAVGLSVLMLVYWQTEPDYSWAQAMNPYIYFASDGLIAAITAVAFSTLLTKGGG